MSFFCFVLVGGLLLWLMVGCLVMVLTFYDSSFFVLENKWPTRIERPKVRTNARNVCNEGNTPGTCVAATFEVSFVEIARKTNEV